MGDAYFSNDSTIVSTVADLSDRVGTTALVCVESGGFCRSRCGAAKQALLQIETQRGSGEGLVGVGDAARTAVAAGRVPLGHLQLYCRRENLWFGC